MKSISNLKEITKLSEKHLETLLSIAKDEKKEEGKTREDTIKRINALVYAIENAYNVLNYGLDGSFDYYIKEIDK